MNIFALDYTPSLSAIWHVDKHVVKMNVEYAQLLSTAHRVIDGTEYIGIGKRGQKVRRWKLQGQDETLIYKACHINHPSAIWCRENTEQYLWLYELWLELGKEYTYRYGKIHSCQVKLKERLATPPRNLKSMSDKFKMPYPAMKQFPQCIVKDTKGNINVVESYRNFYKEDKASFAFWSKRNIPQWW
jgi:hypothetical protein